MSPDMRLLLLDIINVIKHLSPSIDVNNLPKTSFIVIIYHLGSLNIVYCH